MKSCAFFGHRDGLYESERQRIQKIVVDLIKNESVTQFYVGGRGAFDGICGEIIYHLKKGFPWIKSTLVLSYIPQKDFILSEKYDDSVYLLEKAVLPKFAIVETNKLLVQKVDFVVSGVQHEWGGAYQAVMYAKKQNKKVIDLYGV